MSPTPGAADPKTWQIVVLALLSGLLLLASFAFALFGGASYNDSYSHDADRAWGIASLVAGGFLLLASGSALLFLLARKQPIWYAAVTAHGFTLLAQAVVVGEGFLMMVDAKRRGGDWGALAVLGSLIFGILIPTIVGLLTLGSGYFLIRVRALH